MSNYQGPPRPPGPFDPPGQPSGFGAPQAGAPQQGDGGPQQGYGAPQQGHGWPQQGQQGFGAPQPGYGAPQQGFGAPQPGYGAPQQGFGAPQPGFGAPQPGFGAPQPGFGAPQPGFGGQPQVASVGLFGDIPCPQCGMPTKSQAGTSGYAAGRAGGLVGILIYHAIASKRHCPQHGLVPSETFPPAHRSAILLRKLAMVFGALGLLVLCIAVLVAVN